jgi:hypothetical protein
MGDSEQSRTIALVSGSGAVGGLIAWVLQAATGGRLLPFVWYGSVPAALLLGSAAAGIGVYVLANTDQRQLGRLIFFSVLCGVSFKPVFQAGSNYLNGTLSQAKAQSQLSDVQQNTQQLNQAVATQSQAQVQTAVQQTAQSTTTLVQQSASVPDESLRAELQTKSAKVVDAIAAAAPKAPEQSVRSLYAIGLAARQTNQTKLTLHVIDSLRNYEATSTDPATKDLARQYAMRIGDPKAAAH